MPFGSKILSDILMLRGGFQFSEFLREAASNQEYAGGLEQRLDDEAEPVVA
jgi:hypothetical protein